MKRSVDKASYSYQVFAAVRTGMFGLAFELTYLQRVLVDVREQTARPRYGGCTKAFFRSAWPSTIFSGEITTGSSTC